MNVDPGPLLLGSVRGAEYAINRDLIQQIAEALRQQPHAQLYVIVYLGVSDDKFAGIKSRLHKQLSVTKIERARFTFVSSSTKSHEAVFWLIPPGVENPAP